MLHHALTRQHADNSTVMTISLCIGQIYDGYCISTFCIEHSKKPGPVVRFFTFCKHTEKVWNNKYFQRLWSHELNETGLLHSAAAERYTCVLCAARFMSWAWLGFDLGPRGLGRYVKVSIMQLSPWLLGSSITPVVVLFSLWRPKWRHESLKHGRLPCPITNSKITHKKWLYFQNFKIDKNLLVTNKWSALIKTSHHDY